MPEIRGLISRGTFRALLRAGLPDAVNMISARYELAIKSSKDKEDRYKTRYVASGYLEIMKDRLVHGAQTIQYVSYVYYW